jgi:5'-nucleotidase
VTRPLILLTNDDGVSSPGLAAAAAALDPLGDLLIVAPRTQQSGAGRSMPNDHDGRMIETTVCRVGGCWPAHGVNASPAQAIQHALLELADRQPALAVSGINYGENVGISITISGTVGAALEAADHGIASLAISLQVPPELYMNFNDSVDFGAAMHFTRFFAARLLDGPHLPDVDVLKVDVPACATPDTPWRVTRLEHTPYYRPLPPQRSRLDDEGRIGYVLVDDAHFDPASDAAAMVAGVVAVTPLSLDMTSRIAPEQVLKRLSAADKT